MAGGLIKTAYDAVKPAFAVDECSPEEAERRVLELQRCIDDPIYFASNYYYIRSIDKGTILIPLYKKQEELIRAIVDNRFTVALASRQSGKTTAYVAFALWACFFMEGKEIVIVANKEQTAIGILKRIKQSYEWIPKEKSWIKPGVSKWSARIYESIVKGQNVLEAGRPESFNVLLKEMQSLGLDIRTVKKTGEH